MLLSEPEDIIERRNELQKSRQRLLSAKDGLIEASFWSIEATYRCRCVCCVFVTV
jgi:hypothetical protein